MTTPSLHFRCWLALSAIAIGGACSGDANGGRTATPAQSVTIAQWGSEKYLIYLPLYLAQETGAFARRGVATRLIYSGNDDQVFATVLRGDAQFGVGDPIFTAISRQRGFDGVVVASIVDRVALWGVSKRSIPGIRDASGFRNLRVGTFPRPSTTYSLLRDMITNAQVPNARIVEVPIGSETALLESGAADIAMMLEPAASIAESRGYHVVTSFPSLWGPFAFTGLTSTESFVQSNRPLVDSVRAAIAEGVALAHSSPDSVIKIARALFPTLDSAVVANAVRRMLADETIPRSIDISRAGWGRASAVRRSLGDITARDDCAACIPFARP